MSTPPAPRSARDQVTQYHEAKLGELLAHVEDAVRAWRAGEVDAFETDHVIYRYSRAAKELWKFCNLADAASTAPLIVDRDPIDWWAQAAPRRR